MVVDVISISGYRIRYTRPYPARGITIHFGTMDIVGEWRVTDRRGFRRECLLRTSPLPPPQPSLSQPAEGYGFRIDRNVWSLVQTSRELIGRRKDSRGNYSIPSCVIYLDFISFVGIDRGKLRIQQRISRRFLGGWWLRIITKLVDKWERLNKMI